MLGSASETDQAVVVVYCPAKGQAIYRTDVGSRDAGQASISAGLFSGQEVHTWLAFLTADKTKSSDSAYTGKFTLPA